MQAKPPRVLLSHARSGRLHEFVKSKRRRVLHLHKQMIHAPEDIMCYVVQGERPLWKKRKEGMAQWKTRKKYKRSRTAKDRKPSTKEEMTQDDQAIQAR
jgi:hypothetical protein